MKTLGVDKRGQWKVIMYTMFENDLSSNGLHVFDHHGVLCKMGVVLYSYSHNNPGKGEQLLCRDIAFPLLQ